MSPLEIAQAAIDEAVDAILDGAAKRFSRYSASDPVSLNSAGAVVYRVYRIDEEAPEDLGTHVTISGGDVVEFGSAAWFAGIEEFPY